MIISPAKTTTNVERQLQNPNAIKTPALKCLKETDTQKSGLPKNGQAICLFFLLLDSLLTCRCMPSLAWVYRLILLDRFSAYNWVGDMTAG